MKKPYPTKTLELSGKKIELLDMDALEKDLGVAVQRLPFCIRVLVENLARKMDGVTVKPSDVEKAARWLSRHESPVEIAFYPARVLMQDFTGVPAVVDLAAMRDAMKALGGDPGRINPLVPVDLVVDHSVQVDFYGTERALWRNVVKEYERNAERYALLKWAQKSFETLRVVPPKSGICHQVNLESLAQVIVLDPGTLGDIMRAYPDTLVGTDSHTTMINGMGVLGWGVGGIEAEAVMLGQPYWMTLPEVIGVRLVGRLAPRVTATDLVLFITERLRSYNVVEKFVEFFGPSLRFLSLPDRATVANMAPEYGATVGFFPIDAVTLEYLRATGRGDRAGFVEAAAKALKLFAEGPEPQYTDVIELDLAEVEPCVAGPARPQDRIPLKNLKARFGELLGCRYDSHVAKAQESVFMNESGCTTEKLKACMPLGQRFYPVEVYGRLSHIGDGSVVLAAITSCTNTSNPSVMIGAGLLARNAVRRGLRVAPHVKTSLAPGSRVVVDYLAHAGLLPYLEALGFHCVGYGCTTCIGNSGPLHPAVEKVIEKEKLNVAAVLSGNRNFEARIHPRVRSNFLASPMLVVAFALAGRVDVDMDREPLALDPNGDPVYLEDLWPSEAEIAQMVRASVKEDFFRKAYGAVYEGDDLWQRLEVSKCTTFPWDADSTYIRKPPYFDALSPVPEAPRDIIGARALLVLGRSVTTDHISPAGSIPKDYPAGRYLMERGVDPGAFNSYGARRGNHEVMLRGTFGNIRLRNHMADGREGSWTRKLPEGTLMFVYDAAMAYAAEGTPLVVLADEEYGTGSSRDWAAKGTALLGVRAVIAQSFERIHRSNLVGMGVLPLVFEQGQSAASLGLDGTEVYDIRGLENLMPRKKLQVTAAKVDGSAVSFTVTARLETEMEVEYFCHGGILPYVVRKLHGEHTAGTTPPVSTS
ncbi:aconitate hydratase AcnA [Desulfosoma caldarium]|uniref:Aconitate hydratase n=1 Tax=Desulfosoma caldarium TaxID=610254 RepID=A0A3N1US41_9BACT|nr:aconitate hydratase AcnA [Desulfosoma caldarium]ROQ90671.1 aconitate hydratase [Desulfosoma caldarium]